MADEKNEKRRDDAVKGSARKRERRMQLGYALNTDIHRLCRTAALLQRGETEMTESRPRDQSIGGLTISREGGFYSYWFTWISLLIDYSILTTLYYISYDWPGALLQGVDRVVWVSFLVDMVLEFFTDYREAEGEVVSSHQRIAIRYLKGWFLFDLMAVIPLAEFGYYNEECYLRLLRLLKLKRGLDFFDGSLLGAFCHLIYRPANLSETQSQVLFVKYMISFMQIVGSMLFTTYSLAAVFFWWSSFTLDWENAQATHFVTKFKMENMSGVQKLNRSCYFLASTLSTVGYGDYYATNTYEKIMLIGVLLIGITQFSLIVANFNSLLSELDSSSRVGERMDDLTTWIGMLQSAGQKTGLAMRERVLRHFQYYWDNDRLGDLALKWWRSSSIEELVQPEDHYLTEMPEGMSKGVLEFLFSDLGTKYPLFFAHGTDFRLAISLHFQPRFFACGEFILEKDDPVQEIVFLSKGEAACGVMTEAGFKDLLRYPDRCIVGDYEALRRISAIATYQAVSLHGVQALMLPGKVVLKVLREKYPRLFLKVLLLTHSKARYIQAAIDKFRAKGEARIVNPFTALSDRLKSSKKRFFLPLVVGKTKDRKFTRSDLMRAKIELEKVRLRYEERKGALLYKILAKLREVR